MKIFLIFLIIIIIIDSTYAQECIFDIQGTKFVSGFPYGHLDSTYNYASPWLVKWNDDKILNEYC